MSAARELVGGASGEPSTPPGSGTPGSGSPWPAPKLSQDAGDEGRQNGVWKTSMFEMIERRISANQGKSLSKRILEFEEAFMVYFQCRWCGGRFGGAEGSAVAKEGLQKLMCPRCAAWVVSLLLAVMPM